MATSSAEQQTAAVTTGASVPRKYKASDLPLPSATRQAIESLAHSFKKEGAYDDIRKLVWDRFQESVGEIALHESYYYANKLF